MAESTIRFWGSSDDLIEVQQVAGKTKGADEYNGEDATFEVGGLRVRVHYPGYCWAIEVTRIDENVPVTAGNLRLAPHGNGYSMALEMDLPPGAYVTKVASPDA